MAAFERLKELALNAPLLYHPTPDGLFILDTDASDHQIGAALYQIQNGVENPICFASHVLLKQQRHYCTTRKELLAVVKFCRHFRHYLLGRNFLCRTDHNSLTWLVKFKHIEGQLARWLEELSQYNMTVIHRRGSEHVNADALSRVEDAVPECDCYNAGCSLDQLPCGGCPYCSRAHRQWERFSEDVDDVIPLSIRTVIPQHVTSNSTMEGDLSNWTENMSCMQLLEAQLDDPDISLIIYWLQHDYQPSNQELQLCSNYTRLLWLNKDKLSFRSGVLYYIWINHDKLGSRECLIVPVSLREKVLKACHDDRNSGHLGINKTLDRVRNKYYWHSINLGVRLHVQGCHSCNKNKKGHTTPKASLVLFIQVSPWKGFT